MATARTPTTTRASSRSHVPALPVSPIAIERAVRKALSRDKSVPRTARNPDFWPVVSKGGFENTLRDLMLADVQAAIGKAWVCTGERGRLDIAVFNTQDVNRGSFDKPAAVVELKLNYTSQLKEAFDRVAASATRLLAHPMRPPFLVILVICEVQKADALSARLLYRYRAAPGQRPAQRVRQKPDFILMAQKSLKNKGFAAVAKKLASVRVADGTGKNLGQLHFLSIGLEKGFASK